MNISAQVASKQIKPKNELYILAVHNNKPEYSV